MAGKDGLLVLKAEAGPEDGGGEAGNAVANGAGRIDGDGDAVVGCPQHPAAVLDGAHPHQLKMLFAGGGAEEIAVVGDVDKDGCTGARKIAHMVGNSGFVADKGANAGVRKGHGGDGGAGRVGANLVGDLIHKREEAGDVFAEGDQEDFVVADAGRGEEGGVERSAGGVAPDAAEQNRGRGFGGEFVDAGAKVGIRPVEDGAGGFGPDDEIERAPGGGGFGEGHQIGLRRGIRLGGPFHFGVQIGLDEGGVGGGRESGRQRGEEAREEGEKGPGGPLAGLGQEDYRKRSGGQREEKRQTIDAGEGGEAKGDRHVDGGVAEHEPAEQGEWFLGSFQNGPEECGGRGAVPVADQDAGQEAEDAVVDGLEQAEENERTPSAEGAHTAMHLQNRCDPPADARPQNEARRITESEAARGAEFAAEGDQKGCESDGGEPAEVEGRVENG
jgi:hypothetical protein